MFWIMFLYIIATIATGMTVFETISSSGGWSAVLAPLIALSVGTTSRSVFYGDKKSIILSLVFALVIFSAMIFWVQHTGYRVIAFDKSIPGWLWVTLGFVVGFIFIPKKMALENIGKPKVVTPVQIINDFGACMLECEDSIIAFYDEKHLPHPKDKIYGAIAAFLETDLDAQIKEQMKVSLISLAHFQPGVGDDPIHLSPASQMLKEGKLHPEVEDLDKLGFEYLDRTAANLEKLNELKKLYERDMASFSMIISREL